MTMPLTKSPPDLNELVLVAWHALLSNPNNGLNRFDAAQEAIEYAESMQRALQERGQ